MLNGIKKYVIASIPIIFGCLFGISNGYTVESGTTNTYVLKFDANETVSYTPFKLGDITITTNIGFTTDQYENILAYEVDKKNTYVVTYSYWWNETNGLMTNAGSSYYGNNNVTHKQNYVCQSDSTNYITECGLENTNAFANTNTMVSVEDIITNNFNATNYSIENFNYGRGSYGPSILCMINTNEDISYCVKNEYATNNTVYSTKLNAVQNASYITNLSDLYTYINTNYTPEDTPITPSGGGEETTTETTTILGQCPTINQILSTYSSNYNTGICYSATRLLTQTGIVNTTAQSIFELYPTFTGWLEDYNYYKQYCENVPTSVCREAFSGNEIKWSLLNKTPENNPIGVYQYCHLQLNIQDKNTTTCVMSTGQYFATGVNEAIEEEIQGNQSVLDIMLNSFNNLKDELPSFSSGTVFDEFLEEGETWKDGFKLDIFKTFLELWSKITSIFIFRHQYDGIIPTYITSIIVIILLFKILKK